MNTYKKTLTGLVFASLSILFVLAFSPKVYALSNLLSEQANWLSGSYTYVQDNPAPAYINATIKIYTRTGQTPTKTYRFNLDSTNQANNVSQTESYNIYRYNHNGDDGLCSDGTIYVEQSDLKTGYLNVEIRSDPNKGTHSTSETCTPTTLSGSPTRTGYKDRFMKIKNPIANSNLVQNQTNNTISAVRAALYAGATSLKFEDRFHIKTTFKIGGTDKPVRFTDDNPSDDNFNYRPDNDDVICGGKGITVSGMDFTGLGSYKTLSARVDLYAKSTPASKTCDVHIVGSPSGVLQVSTIASPDKASLFYTWDGPQLKRLDNKEGTFTQDKNNKNVLRAGNDNCSDTIVLNSDLSGTEYSLSKSPADVKYAVRNFSDLKPFFNNTIDDCFVEQVNIANRTPFGSKFQEISKKNFTITGTRGAFVQVGSGKADDDSSSCVVKSSTTFEWILCPMITAIGNSIDTLNGFIESQLTFNTSENLNNQVEKAWVIFRNIASALIVIVLLVVIISQAIGSGPFDAYAIRKMLPRIIIAIIAIQLSWELAKFAIDIANSAGRSVAQLMAAPFGGIGNMDLQGLLNHLSPEWALGASLLTLTAFFIAAGTFTAFLLPSFLLVAFLVLVSVIMGLAVLLFRNALIIVCVILAPIALVLWILPGTQRYWKLWSDNFLKLLMLFPIIMAIIYGGRIFAWIAGGLGSEAGPLDFIIVLVGFFAPYFIILKAYKWGGSALSVAGNAVADNKVLRKGREVGSREILDLAKRRSDQAAKDYNPDDPRLGAKRKFGIPYRLTGRIPQSVKARRFIPTRRAGAVMMQRGDEHNEKETAIEETYAKRRRDKATSGERNIKAGKKKSIDMVKDALEVLKDDPTNKAAQRRGKAGIRDLIRSSSWLELATISFIDPTDGKEKFAWETDLWRDTVAPDGELYGAVGRARPDWKPHRLETGLLKYRGETLDDEDEVQDIITTVTRRERIKGNTDPVLVQQEIEREFDKVRDRDSWIKADQAVTGEAGKALALSDVVKEMDSRDLATINPVFFQRVGDTATQGMTILKQAESETDQTKKAIMQRTGMQMLRPAQQLRRLFNNLVSTGNQYALSNIQGADEVSELVDYAIRLVDDDNVTVEGNEDINVVGSGKDKININLKGNAPGVQAIIENHALRGATVAQVAQAAPTTQPGQQTQETPAAPAPQSASTPPSIPNSEPGETVNASTEPSMPATAQAKMSAEGMDAFAKRVGQEVGREIRKSQEQTPTPPTPTAGTLSWNPRPVENANQAGQLPGSVYHPASRDNPPPNDGGNPPS